MNLLKQLLGMGIEGLSATEAANKLKEQPVPFLVDVRQPSEYQAGHIAGAELIPLNQLDQKLQKLPKDREIICVCQSGSRSASAVSRLNALGFKALNLNGGMMAWQMARLPVKKGSAR